MVNFDETFSTDPDGLIARHVWNFEGLCLVGVFRMR